MRARDRVWAARTSGRHAGAGNRPHVFADQLPGDHPNCFGDADLAAGLCCAAAPFKWVVFKKPPASKSCATSRPQAGDKKSLAVGMAGHLNTLTFNSRHREAVQTASEIPRAGPVD